MDNMDLLKAQFAKEEKVEQVKTFSKKAYLKKFLI